MNITVADASHRLRIALLISFLLAVIGVSPFVATAVAADGGTVKAESATEAVADAATRIREAGVYGRLPLYFEANRGQTDHGIKFVCRGSRLLVLLTSTDAVLVFSTPDKQSGPQSNSKALKWRGAGQTALRIGFVGANPESRVFGQAELPGMANYFIGNDPTKWQTNVPTYAKVRYENLYPGVDLVYYGNQRQLEYDFVISPGADPGAIALRFTGADKLEVDVQGDLVLHTAAGQIRQRKPMIYQEVDGVRREIAGGYVLEGTHQVRFQIAAYDASRPLVIDPVLFYSTYLGGGAHDSPGGIAVDASGNAYVTGQTASINFPTTTGAFQIFTGGSFDAFVAKLNPTGSGLVYSTYLGGSGEDNGDAIAVDSSGNAYVTGGTGSTNFPTTTGAFQTTFGGGPQDAFVTKLDPTGSALVYSTFLGGNTRDAGHGIAVDTAGNAYVAGETTSTDFPTMNPFHSTKEGFSDTFVTKVNAAGNALVYSSYLGGGATTSPFDIAVDAAGNAYVTGYTESSTFPATTGAFQATFGGAKDAFVAKVNSLGTGLVYATYLGGSGDDRGSGIAVDTLGNAYVGGLAGSTFPTTTGAFQTTFGGGSFDGFVTKVNPLGTGLVYSTYLGGSGDDFVGGIAVDTSGNAYVTGGTGSTNFPTITGAFQTTFAGGSLDGFVTKVNPLGTGLVYSTYLGGSGDDNGSGIALDALPNPNAYVGGVTASTDFPTTTGAYQTTYGGGEADAFVAKITDVVLPPPPTVGKVTGGGTINVPGGFGNFGFIVQSKTTTGPVDGHLQYHNHASGAKVHSVMFDMLVISGNTATFGGTCINNDVPCTFTVNVIDNGEPGRNDSFTISVNAGPPEGGTLRSGNIQIHK